MVMVTDALSKSIQPRYEMVDLVAILLHRNGANSSDERRVKAIAIETIDDVRSTLGFCIEMSPGNQPLEFDLDSHKYICKA